MCICKYMILVDKCTYEYELHMCFYGNTYIIFAFNMKILYTLEINNNKK